MDKAIDNPMADHKEYLPPTQSQNTNMLAGSIPNLVTSFSLVESAAKCFLIWASSRADCRNHSLAVCALVMVSCVVKVLEAIRKSVSSGVIFLKVSSIWVPSTLETK